MDKDWDEEGSVRAVLSEKRKNLKNNDPDSENRVQNQIDPAPQKSDSKNKDNAKNQDDEEDD